jgi:hypothetical protein
MRAGYSSRDLTLSGPDLNIRSHSRAGIVTHKATKSREYCGLANIQHTDWTQHATHDFRQGWNWTSMPAC